MTEFFPPPSESIEPVEVQEVQVERQALDDATNEPQAYVEQSGNHEQAEAIQATFETVVDNAARASTPVEAAAPEQQTLRADVELPQPTETQEEFIEATAGPARSDEDPEDDPVQLMEARGTEIQPEVEPQVRDGSQVETLPGPMPQPVNEVSDMPGPLPQPVNEVSDMPGPLPQPADEVSDLPGPMPQPADEVSTMPGPLPQPANEVSDLPGPLPQPVSEVSTLPGPLPQPADEVSTLPGPLPQPASEVSAQQTGVDDVGSLPVPFPNEADVQQTGVGDVGSLPVPFPNEADVQQTGVGDVGSLPVPFPNEADVAQIGVGDVSSLPMPLPRPTDQVSPQVDQAQRGTLPIPLPRPAGETHSQVSSKMELPRAGALPDAQNEAAFEPTPDQQVMRADVEMPQPAETQEEHIQAPSEAAASEPVESIPIQLPGEADAALQVDQVQRGTLPIQIPQPTEEAHSKKIKMPKARQTPGTHIEAAPEPLPDLQTIRADIKLPEPWETQEEHIESTVEPARSDYPDDDEEPPLQMMEAREADVQPEVSPQMEQTQIGAMPEPIPQPTREAHSQVSSEIKMPQAGETQEEHIQATSETAASEPVESIPIQLPGEAQPASKANLGAGLRQPAQAGEAAGDGQAGLPQREALPKEMPEQADQIAGVGAQGAFAAKSVSKEIPGGMLGDMAEDSALPGGFDAVENYLKGLPQSGATKGSTGYPGGTQGSTGYSGGHSTTSGSSGTGTQTGWENQGGYMGKPQEDTGHETSGQTVDDIYNEFYNYCKDAYDSGDRPDDGDVSGWVAAKAADFFEERGGDSTLTGILREMAENKEGKDPDGGITVTRLTTDGESDGKKGGGSDDNGDDGGDDGDDDDDDGDDDGGDDDDDDGGDDDGGDDDDDDGGGDDGGDDDDDSDSAMSEEGGDDSGKHAPILASVPYKGEKDDTGQRPGIFGGPGDGGDSDGDDTGGKEGIPLGGAGRIYPDSGGALPIDPIPASELDSGKSTSGSEGLAQSQLRTMEVPGKDNNFSIHLGAGGLVKWERTSTK
jgi:hypothetical protein